MGGTIGVGGVTEGEWVVVVGQHLLRQQMRDNPESGRSGADARIRPTSWQRVQELQGLQREDLLAGFLDKQQRIAAALGAEIPASEDAVARVLQGDAAAGTGGN